MCVQSSPVEIRTPTQRNLIDHSMTAPLPVLTPSSVLPSPSSPCAYIPATKNLAFQKLNYFSFFTYFKTACPKLRNLKLRGRAMYLGSVRFESRARHRLSWQAFRDFSQSLHQTSGRYDISHGCFLPHLYKCVIHCSFTTRRSFKPASLNEP
jgi:hypothetical protein